MKIERIDRLTEPAVVGRVYLVPTILARWPYSNDEWYWPVIGPKHADEEFFNFSWDHYHVDPRFVRAKYVDSCFATPLSNYRQTLGEIVWRPRKMRRATFDYPYGHTDEVQNLRAAFAGQQCPRGKHGWICPHRKAPLGSIAPVNGVITCPLHGLRINARTGVVILEEQLTLPV